MNTRFVIWIIMSFIAICLFFALGITYLDVTIGFSPSNFSIGVLSGILGCIVPTIFWTILK